MIKIGKIGHFPKIFSLVKFFGKTAIEGSLSLC